MIPKYHDHPIRTDASVFYVKRGKHSSMSAYDQSNSWKILSFYTTQGSKNHDHPVRAFMSAKICSEKID